MILVLSVLLAHLGACQQIQPGALNGDDYLPILNDKSVGLVVNHTSMVGQTHLVDYLISNEINVKRIFAPEHGFRGDQDAGAKIKNTRDESTGLPVVSLYGKNYKPTERQIADLDYMIFDIQDVGVRCFTFISTLHYVMEACAENNVKLIVLDRPNPNIRYTDGPMLDTAFTSFVGKHPIPLMYGMTIGELAQMINGEGWLAEGNRCDLTVIPISDYDRDASYECPIKPSPNMPNAQAIRLYASLVFFEGTVISMGRGTYEPFQMIGYPDPAFGNFQFVPISIDGMEASPKYKDETCYGLDLRMTAPPEKVDINYVVDFYSKSKNKSEFFNSYFKLLAGTDQLQQQIIDGLSAQEIHDSWQPAIDQFKEKRKAYLLYK